MAKKSTGKKAGVQRKIDQEKLKKMIEEGKTVQEIREAFGDVGMLSLRNGIMQVYFTSGKEFAEKYPMWEIKGLYGYGGGSKEVSYQIAGTAEFIRISKNKVPEKYRKKGMKFTVKEAENGILLEEKK
jgi:hypothetical protein